MIWFASWERGRKMTEKEKIIVSAYTGILMTDFSKVHEYVEKKLDRPVWTHEFAFESVQEEIKEKSEDDFLDLCKKDDDSKIKLKGKWIAKESITGLEKFYECSNCGNHCLYEYVEIGFQNAKTKYCPNCGAEMEFE
jgi:Pyruvate/2-oxoacid:ferredoxin oxidoreductase delta subunit